MTSLCPVCNGLSILNACCPKCFGHGIDQGRYNDFIGPYSPYRQIDDVGLSNGFLDVGRHLCVHAVKCAACRHEFTSFVQEWQ